MLSEFAGAAQSLGAGAILVNPWNITDLAAAIEHSLTMRSAHLLVMHLCREESPLYSMQILICDSLSDRACYREYQTFGHLLVPMQPLHK